MFSNVSHRHIILTTHIGGGSYRRRYSTGLQIFFTSSSSFGKFFFCLCFIHYHIKSHRIVNVTLMDKKEGRYCARSPNCNNIVFLHICCLLVVEVWGTSTHAFVSAFATQYLCKSNIPRIDKFMIPFFCLLGKGN